MKHSETLGGLAPAMAKAQAAIGAAKKTSKGNYGKYADLASVWDACEAALEANGLVVLQGFSTEGGADGSLWTMLLHTGGEYIIGTCPLVLGKRDPQGIGSATTYYRRYGLAAMLGITQEDDDGQRSMLDKTPPRELPKAQAKASGNADLQAASDQATDYAATLDESTDAADLEARWAKIPAAYKGTLFNHKKAVKAKLNGGN